MRGQDSVEHLAFPGRDGSPATIPEGRNGGGVYYAKSPGFCAMPKKGIHPVMHTLKLVLTNGAHIEVLSTMKRELPRALTSVSTCIRNPAPRKEIEQAAGMLDGRGPRPS